MKLLNLSSIAISLIFLRTTLAHPGEDHSHVKREAELLTMFSKRDTALLKRCYDSEPARLLRKRSSLRRLTTANQLLGRSIQERDLESLQGFESENHNQTGSITLDDPAVLFSGNTSCILSPEVTIGPYYVLGEYVRSNVTESQPGIPMHLEMQFIDVNSCTGIESLLVDIWHVNSTGTYSGIASEGGLNSTWLRGVQQSSTGGVVEFDTIFPGHYSGRAVHTHLAVHTNASLLSNGSYAGGIFSHIGQLFYDEELINAVEGTSPYSSNAVKRTTNDEDQIAQSQADNNYDPLVQYIYLNPLDISQGILAWIEIGIDPSANHSASANYAAYLAADGGHANGNAMGGPGGSPPGGLGMPGGNETAISSAGATSSNSTSEASKRFGRGGTPAFTAALIVAEVLLGLLL